MSLLDGLEYDGVRGGASKSVAPIVVIKLAGEPQSWERAGARIVTPKNRKPQFIHFYTPAKTRDYEAQIRAAALDAMAGRAILDEPLEVIVFAYFGIPESWSEKKRQAALAGLIRPTGRPDADNLFKTVDALNPFKDPKTGIRVPVVWRDDSLVVDGRAIKLYARHLPGIIVEVRPAGLPPQPWGV